MSHIRTAISIFLLSKLLITVKRVYAPVAADDGLRILVDRLWPRGLSREQARIDEWHKAIAPSAELRRWFAHEPDRYDEFQRRYHAELECREDQVAELKKSIGQSMGKGRCSLLYAAKDEIHNNAVALRTYLLAQ